MWKYNKIAGNGGNLKYWSYLAMCENTTRFQARHYLFCNVWKYKVAGMGGKISYWSHQLFCNAGQYNKIAGNGGIFKSLKPAVIAQCLKVHEATSYFAMCDNTTRLQAMGENWKYCNRQCIFHKIARNGAEFQPLKPPIVLPRVKIQQDSRQAASYFAMFENIQDCRQRGKIRVLTPPDILHCLKLQQDCRQQGEILVFEATRNFAIFESTTR